MSPFELQDLFFAPRIARNAVATIPSALKKCRETGRISAFDLTWKPGDPNEPHIFFDSDVAKVLEGMCRMYEINGDAALRTEIDELAAKIASAQQPDGYLNTHFTLVEPQNRFANLHDCHELYCAGHLMEAASAHYRATGSRVLLDALCRYADYLNQVFGPGGERRGCPGHEEIELALAELSETAVNPRYLLLAKQFLDVRGTAPNSFLAERDYPPESLIYLQAHKPVREQHTAEGHAVRMLYLARGMAEVGMRTGDSALMAACEDIAKNIAEQRMFITGGIGSTTEGEAFTVDGDLPDTDAYAESCATIALAFFARTMLAATRKRFYGDLIERAIFNGATSGISLDGTHFFYANPHASSPATHERGWTSRKRQEWFGCSCCPTTYVRYLPQLAGLCVQVDVAKIQVTIPSAGVAKDADGKEVLRIEGKYPYDGKIAVTWLAADNRLLRLRIPSWCKKAVIRRNDGEDLSGTVRDSWLELPGSWRAGETVALDLDMSAELIYPAPRLVANRGMAAVCQGPLVYCLEGCDNPGWRLGAGAFAAELHATTFVPDGLPEGTLGLEVDGFLDARADEPQPLYSENAPQWRPARLRLVPYALWQNRADGNMAIYQPVK